MKSHTEFIWPASEKAGKNIFNLLKSGLKNLQITKFLERTRNSCLIRICCSPDVRGMTKHHQNIGLLQTP